MALLPAAVPLSAHRARVAQYLRGVDFSFTAPAGRIIDERLAGAYVRDPDRPALVLWACAAYDSDLRDSLPVAAAFDLFDRFMLLHDELADESAATIARWGLGQSLNAGDALYAVAFRTLAGSVVNPERRLRVARLVGQAVLEAIERPDAAAEGEAALTAAALQAGALLGGARDRAARSFARAGWLLGIAARSSDAAAAQNAAQQAVAALRRHAGRADLEVFEEVALNVAQRAA
jgi:hypothetical protein